MSTKPLEIFRASPSGKCTPSRKLSFRLRRLCESLAELPNNATATHRLLGGHHVMSLPTVILPKLRRLIPLLSSDVAGEVVATAPAITRTLAAARRDWHDLAAQLAEPSADAPQLPPST